MKYFLAFSLFLAGLNATSVAATDPKLPSLKEALSTLAPTGYKDEPLQIPATVIDNGKLQLVPYHSFRVGPDRELNVYGDPTAPACVEVGLYRGLLSSEEEKRRCIAYIRTMLAEVDLSSLKLTGGKILKGGVIVEITTPDAPDAYGGWWISAYSLPLLHKAAGIRASVSEVSVSLDATGGSSGWSVSDLSNARPHAGASSGRVYVRSYVRRDGTYVRSHTRSK